MNETKVPYGMLAIWFLGQESVVIKGGETTVYIDPYMSDNAKRTYSPPLRPEDITNATYCLITHEHGDHLDSGTIPQVAVNNPAATFMAPGFCRDHMIRLGVNPEQLLDARTDEWRAMPDIRIKPIPAAHEQLDYDPARGHRFVGYLLELNGVKLYHAGDTTVYPGLIESLKAEAIEVGMLPINGRDAFRTAQGIIGNMDYREAVELAVSTGMDTVIPMHYDMFKGNGLNPGYFLDYLYATYPEQKSHIMGRFERFIYVSTCVLK
ncbi:MBL fold metallo-hydrolase [Paenibacillus cremeus]|uniref:MBL fold metallo-hydrolase n=1 Tax=Paenibacillus cremeus TaxID=2163881 RepID=A0A559JVR1_9BACL|nr:MBL fold metallo-hydrolase [Paenibacillus cremeus]TVY03976.1 MBL fold metallo-hydrolase [Paenibacillus cremeus]